MDPCPFVRLTVESPALNSSFPHQRHLHRQHGHQRLRRLRSRRQAPRRLRRHPVPAVARHIVLNRMRRSSILRLGFTWWSGELGNLEEVWLARCSLVGSDSERPELGSNSVSGNGEPHALGAVPHVDALQKATDKKQHFDNHLHPSVGRRGRSLNCVTALCRYHIKLADGVKVYVTHLLFLSFTASSFVLFFFYWLILLFC